MLTALLALLEAAMQNKLPDALTLHDAREALRLLNEVGFQ